MSCNISIPLQRIIDDVAEALAGKYISVDNPFLNESVLTDTTFRGDITMDTAARDALCSVIQNCNITAAELEWLATPTGDGEVAISSITGGVSWISLAGFVEDIISDIPDPVVRAEDVVISEGLSQADYNETFASYGYDTGITVTAKNGSLARNLADKVQDSIDLRDFTKPTDADHTSGIQAAADAAKLSKKPLIGAGTYHIKSGDVNFRHLQTDLKDCTFIVSKPYKIIGGGHAGTGNNPTQHLGSIRRPVITTVLDDLIDPTLQIIGAKGQNISISYIDYLQFYQSSDPTTFPADASQAYSIFNITSAIKISVDTDPRFDGGASQDGAGSRNQWFNENTINLGRCYGFYIRGSYPHNHNIINGGAFEGNSVIRIEHGNKNTFKSLRLEGSNAKVYFGEDSSGNTLERGWFSVPSNFYFLPEVEDYGILNDVRVIWDKASNKRVLMRLTELDAIYDNVLQDSNVRIYRAASRNYIKGIPLGFAAIASTKICGIKTGEFLMATLKGTAATSYIMRIFVYGIDKKQIMLTAESDYNVISLFTINAVLGCYERTFTGLNFFGLRDDRIKYVRVEIVARNTRASQTATDMTIFINSLEDMTKMEVLTEEQTTPTKVSLTKPTQFVGEVGQVVPGLTEDYKCTYMVYTKTTSATNSDVLVVNVDNLQLPNVGSTAVGDLIGIELDDGSVHWSTVESTAAKAVTISTALPSVSKTGSSVYVSRLV